ncbi:unnamed protein product [Urochloa decumbens]|uniref:Uncharacterized protein n=1 Tax=Urochloa decumbens TaxID=240449 RepID=A0ABC8VPD0_9POAL
MSSGQSSPMESASSDPPTCPHHGDGAPAAVSANKKLWRAMQAVYLVVVKKHQPKLAALGVHLHHLLSISSRRDRRRGSLAAAARDDDEHPVLATFLSSLSSCRSMDPAGAVVHPYPRRRVSSLRPAAPASSLSCRSMDPAAAVCQYQYRPREVEFSCKSTPMHKRRRREQRLRRQQERAAAAEQGRRWGHYSSEPEYYHYRGSAAAVTTLFALMDVEEEEAAAKATAHADDGGGGGDLDVDGTVAALTMGPAARQVRITDSPYLMWDDDSEEGWGAVDRRADEFITSFYEQLRTQQPRGGGATRYLTR